MKREPRDGEKEVVCKHAAHRHEQRIEEAVGARSDEQSHDEVEHEHDGTGQPKGIDGQSDSRGDGDRRERTPNVSACQAKPCGFGQPAILRRQVLRRHDVDHGPMRELHQPAHQALAQQGTHRQATRGVAHHDMSRAGRHRVLRQLLGYIVTEQRDYVRTQLFGQIDVGAQSSALVGIELLALRRLDHHRSERPMVGLRHIRSGPDGFHVARIVRYVHQHVLAGLHARARLGAFGLARQPIGHAAQRDLAQRRQVLPGEEVAERRAGAIGKVYLSRLQALDQIVWLDIDELDRCSLVEDTVGNALGYAHVRDGGDLVIEPFEVLDVHGGEHVDTCAQQLLDVLVALPMPATRGVRVGQFVHQHDLGMARQHGVQVELAQRDASMLNRRWGDLLQSVDKRHRIGPRVGFDVTDDHVEPLFQHGVGLLEHGVGLTHARRIAEEYLELAARIALGSLLLDDLPQDRIGVAPCFVVHNHTRSRIGAAIIARRRASGSLSARSRAHPPENRTGAARCIA